MIQPPRRLRPPTNGVEERLDHIIDIMHQQLELSKSPISKPDTEGGEFEVREPTADQSPASQAAQMVPAPNPDPDPAPAPASTVDIPEQSTLSAKPLSPKKKGSR